MSVTLHEGAITRFFQSANSAVAQRLILPKAQEVHDHALANLAPHHRSGDAESGMGVSEVRHDPDGMYVLVGTDAKHPWKGHDDFPYPTALEKGGFTPDGKRYGPFPFLEPALIAAGFRPGAE